MVMRWLIQEWIAQWLGLRDRLRDSKHESDGWWLSIRERILRFMVSRYIDDPADVESHARAMTGEHPGVTPAEQRRTFCRVAASNAYGPRKCVELEAKLRSVRRVNESKQPRWRWL
jgi:hypothetical protein